MKIKKILASVLLAVTLFNVGIISHADEIDNSSSAIMEEQIDSEQDKYSLKDFFNKLEKENKISKEENKEVQKEIRNNDIKAKIKAGLTLLAVNSLVIGVFLSFQGKGLEQMEYFGIGAGVGVVLSALETLPFFLINGKNIVMERINANET